MLRQLLIGSSLICLSIVIEALFIGLAIAWLQRRAAWLGHGHIAVKHVATLTGLTLWMLASHGLSILSWACLFLWLDCFGQLEAAFYFSSVSFTTLGYGDLTLPQGWRLLSGTIATNGMILFSLTTAFLLESFRRMRVAERPAAPKELP